MKPGVYLEPDLLSSLAYKRLCRYKWGIPIYLHFLRKRQIEKLPGKYGKRAGWKIKNNGEICFPYNEAIKEFGFDRKVFTRVIDVLISLGFLGVKHQGTGPNDPSLYSLLDNWKKYENSDFLPPPKRRKGSRRPGWPRSVKLKISVGKTPLTLVGKKPPVKPVFVNNQWSFATGFTPSKLPQDVN